MQNYILKFDEMKGDYVICQQPQRKTFFNMLGNGFFRRKDEKILENGLKTLENTENNTNSNQNYQNLPQNTPTNNTPVQVPDSVPLLADLYNRFRILSMIYQNLASINNNFAQIFNDFINTNNALQGGLLNIYYSVSGQNNPPQQNLSLPILPAEATGILQILANYLQKMREINYDLINLFQVESIDRQLNLIETALSIQASQITNLRLDRA